MGESEEGDSTQRTQRKSALRLRSGQAEFAEKRRTPGAKAAPGAPGPGEPLVGTTYGGLF